MLTFICREEKGIVKEVIAIGEKPDEDLYGDESRLTIDNNACMDMLCVDIADEYTEDDEGEEYTYEQTNVTMPFNKIVKDKNRYHISAYFFRDFGHVIVTDSFQHIRLATT